MLTSSRSWVHRLIVGLTLGAVLGAATVSRGTAGRGGTGALEALAAHVTVVNGPLDGLAGPHIIFEGVNVHIRSGSGATDDGSASGGTTTGLGNLMIGYNALPAEVENPVREGGHTVVIGDQHQYSSWGSLVAGVRNIVSAEGASVAGGTFNGASNIGASVSGGTGNLAAGIVASVSGGEANTAATTASSVSGGVDNAATNRWASVSGGSGNEASGTYSTVTGGLNNEAASTASSVSGGSATTAGSRVCWRAGTVNSGC